MMVAGDDDGGGGGGGKMSKSEKDQVGRRGPSLYILRGCLFFTLLLRKVQRKAVLLRATQLVARPQSFSGVRPSHGREAFRLQQLLLRFVSLQTAAAVLTVAVRGTAA